jgi:hypothetical protein
MRSRSLYYPSTHMSGMIQLRYSNGSFTEGIRWAQLYPVCEGTLISVVIAVWMVAAHFAWMCVVSPAPIWVFRSVGNLMPASTTQLSLEYSRQLETVRAEIAPALIQLWYVLHQSLSTLFACVATRAAPLTAPARSYRGFVNIRKPPRRSHSRPDVCWSTNA